MAFAKQAAWPAVCGLLALMALAIAPAAASTCAGDNSWIQAYNAGFVRVKAAGIVTAAFERVEPGFVASLPALADCPAVPSTFPFPSRRSKTRLDQILRSRSVKVALQDLGPELAGFTQAFKNITESIVAEVCYHGRGSVPKLPQKRIVLGQQRHRHASLLGAGVKEL
jgi:hypothetical protein